MTKPCLFCKQEFKCKGNRYKFCSQHCWRKSKVGKIRKNIQGYCLVYLPDSPLANARGYVYEHRLVISEKIGRPLESYELVHHKNGIKDDNRVSNLEIVLRNTHLGEVTCPHCGCGFSIK